MYKFNTLKFNNGDIVSYRVTPFGFIEVYDDEAQRFRKYDCLEYFVEVFCKKKLNDIKEIICTN